MKIIAKNYRCFSEKYPLIIELSRGITSIVGVNNAGKSTIFRMIYELRELWKKVLPDEIINSISRDGSINVKTTLVEPHKMFYAHNDHDISIVVSLDESSLINIPQGSWVSRLEFGLSRSRVNNWKIKMFTPGSKEELNREVLSYENDRYTYRNSEAGTDLSLKAIFQAMNILEKCLYIDGNRFAVSKSGGSHYDLPVGKEFVNCWRNWKLGHDTTGKKKIISVQKNIRHVFQYNSLDINPSNDGEDMELTIDDVPSKLSEMGDGMSQFILAFGIAAMKEPSFILIDEPERGLHASMQLDFVTSLASYAEFGMMLSTHSVGLARSVSDGKILSLHKGKDGVQMHDLEAVRNLSELLGSLNYSAYRDLGFEKVLLVEGTTEVKVFQQFLRKYHLDHKIVTLPLGGGSLIRGGVGAELEEVKRLANNNVTAIVDSEKSSETEFLQRDRESFMKLCGELNIPCLVTEYRATENYFSKSAINRAFRKHNYAPLGKFEKLDKRNHWRKCDNWRIAREMDKEELSNTDIGRFIEEYLK